MMGVGNKEERRKADDPMSTKTVIVITRYGRLLPRLLAALATLEILEKSTH